MKISSLSPLAKLNGLKKGDDITKINGFLVKDELDLLFVESESKFEVELIRSSKTLTKTIRKKPYQSLDLSFEEEMKPFHCKNKCMFCFVDQLPKGLRDTLYIKDDDYRFSFISGCYVTLTNLSDDDIDRIIRLKLSPLYVSVHAMDDDVRLRLVTNPNTLKLKERLQKLSDGGIQLHTQLVIVPKVNDKEVMCNSITELSKIKNVVSVAVVPVGLTCHRDKLAKIDPITESEANETIDMVENLNAKLGGFCWCSDEYYVKASRDLPAFEYYGDFEQIENGVGLIADFQDKFNYALEEIEPKNVGKRMIFATGTSFAPILAKTIEPMLKKLNIEGRVQGIKNNFFGETVTVAGLVTAGDIIAQIEPGSADFLVIPDNMLKEFSNLFLDSKSIMDVESALNMTVKVVSHDGSDMPVQCAN